MKLNTIQRAVLFLSASIIIVMILFPPTTFTTYSQLVGEEKVFSGYQFIGHLHTNSISPILLRSHETNASIYQIDSPRLNYQLIGLVLITIFILIGTHGLSLISDPKTTVKKSKINKPKSKISIPKLVGIGLITLSVTMFIYLIQLFISQDLEKSIGFLVGYFFIPATVFGIGAYVVYHSNISDQDE